MLSVSPFYFFVIAAVALFLLELGIFQLSVFWFLFAALGASITAGVCWFFPDTGWTVAIACFFASTLGVVMLMYPLLKRLQNQGGSMPGHDAVGQRVQALEAVEPGAAGLVTWSGQNWEAFLNASSASALAKGDEAVIESLEGIRLNIRLP